MGCKDLKQQHCPGFLTPAIFAYGLHKRLYISSVLTRCLKVKRLNLRSKKPFISNIARKWSSCF
jgi:hypothetical protein